MFNVSLTVFDTTQVIQITPNTCPTGGISTSTSFFSTIGGISENDFTGNIEPPYGPGSVPNYANFGANGSQLVEWSLLPFQTTGTSITGCFDPTVTCSAGINLPVQLPTNVTVNAQTLAQYNSCALPTGTFGGNAITGASVPGVGSLTQTGPLSQTTFVPNSNASNGKITIYACRPTVAPAWLNSPLYPGNSLTPPGSPEQYANGNGPFGGPNAASVQGCSAPGDPLKASYPNCAIAGQGPVPSVSGLTCQLNNGSVGGPGPGQGGGATSRVGVFRPGSTNGSSFLLDQTGAEAYIPGQARFILNFFAPGGFNGVTSAAGDIAVSGDWSGSGTTKVGVYRPSTGQWFLDYNNNGIYDSGDLTYNFGGVAGDKPVVGDWNGVGRSCVGLFRAGFLWVLDINCNGTFDGTGAGQDNAFGFGGIAGDVPVVGAFTGTTTKVAVVRAFSPGGVQQSAPFMWVIDNAVASDKTQADHIPSLTGATAPFAFGGVPCTSTSVPGCPVANPLATSDIYVAGDWLGNGTYHAGIYRAGSWLLDLTGAHTYDTFFQFGGVSTDQPIVGKW